MIKPRYLSDQLSKGVDRVIKESLDRFSYMEVGVQFRRSLRMRFLIDETRKS